MTYFYNCRYYLNDFKPLVFQNCDNYSIAPSPTLIFILSDRQPYANEFNNLKANQKN